MIVGHSPLLLLLYTLAVRVRITNVVVHDYEHLTICTNLIKEF